MGYYDEHVRIIPRKGKDSNPKVVEDSRKVLAELAKQEKARSSGQAA